MERYILFIELKTQTQVYFRTYEYLEDVKSELQFYNHLQVAAWDNQEQSWV